MKIWGFVSFFCMILATFCIVCVKYFLNINKLHLKESKTDYKDKLQ